MLVHDIIFFVLPVSLLLRFRSSLSPPLLHFVNSPFTGAPSFFIAIALSGLSALIHVHFYCHALLLVSSYSLFLIANG